MKKILVGIFAALAALSAVLPAHAQFNTGSGGVGVTSVSPGCGTTTTPNPITHTGSVGMNVPLSASSPVTAATYTIQASDACNLLLLNSGASVLTLPNAATAGFGANNYWMVNNQSGGTITINITSPSNLDGSGSITIVDNTAMSFQSDGTNYHFVVRSAPGIGTVTSFTGACGITTTPSPLTNAGTVQGSVTLPAVVTVSSPPITSAYCGGLVQLNGVADLNPTIAQAGSAGFPAGALFTVCNIGATTQTIAPTGGTIGGLSAYKLTAGTASSPVCVSLISDGAANYVVVAGSSAIGAVTTQNGTTYTFAASDCGSTVLFTNVGAVTTTIPQGLPIGCVFAAAQIGAGRVAVNGSAVTPATLHNAYGFTGTALQYSVIGVFIDASNDAILTGDGS